MKKYNKVFKLKIINDYYATYTEHYKRMLNQRPSSQLIEDDFDAYAFDRPWISTLEKNSPILDIGCGYGHQIFILNKLGFSNLSGVEVTEVSFKIAVEEVGSFSKLQFIDAFDYLNETNETFSVVILNDVLEHIPRERTVEILRAIYNVLRPGGVLSVRVPNMSSLLSSYSMYLDFTHLVGFTEFSLMQVFDLAGFSNHQVVHKKRKIKIRSWRPWSPLRGLGLTSIANEYLHKILYRLRSQTPLPTVFDYNLEMWTKK